MAFIIDDIFMAAMAASAIFGGVSVIEGQKAGRRARNAQHAQRQLQNLRAAKERSQSIREARLAYASAQNNAALGGVMESSGSQGGLGSIKTQGNANLAFIQRQQDLAELSGKWLDSAAKAESSAALFGGLSSLASSSAFAFAGPPGGTTTTPKKLGTTSSAGSMGKGVGDITKFWKQ